MRKIFLSLPLLIFSSQSHSQEQYVEVIVRDTVLAEPQIWNLLVHIEKQFDYSMTADSTVMMTDSIRPNGVQSPKELNGTSMEQLKALLKKFNGTIMNDSPVVSYNLVATSMARQYVDAPYLSVYFTSRRSLEGFLKAASSFKDVEAQITGTSSSNLKSYEAKLDSKLVAQGKEKAMRLAELNGKRLGPVISVSETAESEAGVVRDLIETMIKYDGAGEARRAMAWGAFPDKIKLERALKIRFALQ